MASSTHPSSGTHHGNGSNEAAISASPELQSLSKVRSHLRQFLDTSQAVQPPAGHSQLVSDVARLSLSPITPVTDTDRISNVVLSEEETSPVAGLLDVEDSVGVLQRHAESMLSQLQQPRHGGATSAYLTSNDRQPLQSTLDPLSVQGQGASVSPSALITSTVNTPTALSETRKSPRSASAAMGESSVSAENTILRESVQRERLRRKTCEKKIHGLHEKLLMTRQQLALALAQRRKRETMLQQLDKSLLQLSAGWQEREDQNIRDVQHLTEELERQKVDRMQQTEMLEQSRLQLSHVQHGAQEERQRTESLRQAHAAEVQRLSSEHTSTLEQLAGEREHVLDVEGKLAEMQSAQHQLEARCRELEAALADLHSTHSEERQALLKKEQEQFQHYQNTTTDKMGSLNEQVKNAEKKLMSLQLELEAVQQEKENLAVKHAVEVAKQQTANDKAIEQSRAELDRQLAAKTAVWREELFASETKLREHNRVLLEQMQSQHHAELQTVTAKYKNELSDMDRQLSAIETKYKERLAEAEKKLQAEMSAKLSLSQEKSALSFQIQSVLSKQQDELFQLLGGTTAVPASLPAEGNDLPWSAMGSGGRSTSLRQLPQPTSRAGEAVSLGSLPSSNAYSHTHTAHTSKTAPNSQAHTQNLSPVRDRSQYTSTSPLATPKRHHASEKFGPRSSTLASSPIVALSNHYNPPVSQATNNRDDAHHIDTHTSPDPLSTSAEPLASSTLGLASDSDAAKEQLALLLSRIAQQHPPTPGSGGSDKAKLVEGGKLTHNSQRASGYSADGAIRTTSTHSSHTHYAPLGQSSLAMPEATTTSSRTKATTTTLASSRPRNSIPDASHPNTVPSSVPHPTVTSTTEQHQLATSSSSSLESRHSRGQDSSSQHSDAMEMSTMTTSFVERLQVHQSRQSDLLAYLNQVLESSPTRRPTTAGALSSATTSRSTALPVRTRTAEPNFKGVSDDTAIPDAEMAGVGSLLTASESGQELLEAMHDILQSAGVTQTSTVAPGDLASVTAELQVVGKSSSTDQARVASSAQSGATGASYVSPATDGMQHDPVDYRSQSSVEQSGAESSFQNESNVSGLEGSVAFPLEATVGDSSLPALASPIRYTLAFPHHRYVSGTVTTAMHYDDSIQDGPAVALPETKCGTSTRPISHNMAEGADTPRHIASGKPTSSTRAADDAPHEYVLGTIQDLSPSQLSRLKASENVISQLESQTNAENAPEESWSKSPKSSPKKAISFEKSSQRRTETESKESRVASSASLNPRTGSYLQGSSVRHHAAGLGPVAARTGLAPFLRTSQQPLPSAAAATSKPLRTSTTKTHLHGTRASPKHSTRPQAAPVKSRPLQSGSKSGHQSSTGRPARRSLLRELQHPPSSQH